MSLPAEALHLSDPYYTNDHCLRQHYLQPQSEHWLTRESPISRTTASNFLPHDHFMFPSTSTGYTSMPSLRHVDDQESQLDEIVMDEPVSNEHQLKASMSHLHISDVEQAYNRYPNTDSSWMTPTSYPVLPESMCTYNALPAGCGGFSQNCHNPLSIAAPSSPYSTASGYDDSPLDSPYLSSPEAYSTMLPTRPPRSSPNDEYDIDDEEEGAGGKPYARLIFEALLQSPGHRMMLRDIYEWFELNTTKPRESGTNGWQNSIRHNLSMNKAFENDKTCVINARGEPKKATSVWYLTQTALRHGVQSTTRYRKTGVARKSGLNSSPDLQRQRSGAKGGRAARRAARLRRLEQTPTHTTWSPMLSPQDLEPFNNLVQAANYVQDFSMTRSGSPPTPPEHSAFTPPSPNVQHQLPASITHDLKCNDIEDTSNAYQPQDMLFSPAYEESYDGSW